MLRRLCIAATAAIALLASASGTAAASDEDPEERCLLADFQISLIAELEPPVVLEAALPEGCIPGMTSDGADCNAGPTDDGPGSSTLWRTTQREPWAASSWSLPEPPARRIGVPTRRAPRLCDGYARGLDRPPQG